MAIEDTEPNCVVKLGKKGVTILRGQIGEVKCRVRFLSEERVMLFEPAIEDRLELLPVLVVVPPGSSKVIRIQI